MPLSQTCTIIFHMHLGTFVSNNTNSFESITECMILLIIPLFAQRANTKSMTTVWELGPSTNPFQAPTSESLNANSSLQGVPVCLVVQEGPKGS